MRDPNLDRTWMQQALCAQIDMDMHFPRSNALKPREPVAVCRACSVLANCREYVMTLEVGFAQSRRVGVWAGMYPNERIKYEPQWLAEQVEGAA
jgi:hypothetical protein